MNSVGCVSIYTLFDRQPVRAGDEIGEAKVTPLLAPSAEVERAELYAATPPVKVLPFKALRAAALILERISPDQARRVAAGLSNKLAWFGSSLKEVRYLAPGSRRRKHSRVYAGRDRARRCTCSSWRAAAPPTLSMLCLARWSRCPPAWSASAYPPTRAACCGSPTRETCPS